MHSPATVCGDMSEDFLLYPVKEEAIAGLVKRSPTLNLFSLVNGFHQSP